MAVDESGHSPENGASVGCDRSPGSGATRQSLPQFAVLRVKKIVLPFGETEGCRHSPDRIPRRAQKSVALAETKSTRPNPEET
jgi:hypothetical protein